MGGLRRQGGARRHRPGMRVLLFIAIVAICAAASVFRLSRQTAASRFDSNNRLFFAAYRGKKRSRHSDVGTTVTPDVEVKVIAFREEQFRMWKERNSHSTSPSPFVAGAGWFPSVNGSDHGVLREWLFNITGRASEFRNSTSHYLELYRDHAYRGLHSVGCYLSHWHALKDVAERPPHLRPKVLFVFEDDAACIPKTVERTLEILASLPDDWDLFYPGGKPFSYYDNAKARRGNFTEEDGKDKSRFRNLACAGRFGNALGPLAPDGSRNLTDAPGGDRPYWRTMYTTNTEAYVVNVDRGGLDRVVGLLDRKTSRMEPVDIVLGDAMSRSGIKSYMTTRRYCEQNRERPLGPDPVPWISYFHIPGIGYHWDNLLFPECPGRY